jgi:hypothetical protein
MRQRGGAAASAALMTGDLSQDAVIDRMRYASTIPTVAAEFRSDRGRHRNGPSPVCEGRNLVGR